MESLGLWEIIVIGGVSVSGAMIVAFGFWVLSTWTPADRYTGIGNVAPTFLFDGSDLRDATPDAQLLIKNTPHHMSDRESLLHVLGDRFPKLLMVMTALRPNQVQTIAAADSPDISLEVADIDGLVQVRLLGTCTQDGLTISAIAAQDALTSELKTLRTVIDKSPHLIWQQDCDGQLNWANDAYLTLSDQLSDDQNAAMKSWPSKAVFPDLHHDAKADECVKQRKSIDIPAQNGEAWFDIATIKNGTNALHYAHSANATVTAEYAKRQAMQTFGRIFANLPTGLAVFDDARRLSMFNPALINMTNLSPEFLSTKPSMQMFLDRLREARLLPEPKDYLKWREQFPLAGTSTKATQYCENWEIADGQTFKITGQPNRDNTYAFFFEDISAEVSLTRRFRSDIETGQGVLDALPDAIAVFSANGTLVMTNCAYSRLWDVERDTNLRTHDLRAEMFTWQSQCAAAPIWSELRDFIGRSGERGVWSDRAILDDGRQLTCKAQPIAGGMTMITFTLQSKARPRLHHNLTSQDPAICGLKS